MVLGPSSPEPRDAPVQRRGAPNSTERRSHCRTATPPLCSRTCIENSSVPASPKRRRSVAEPSSSSRSGAWRSATSRAPRRGRGSIRVAQLLHGRLPSIPLADCAWVGSTVMIYVAGIWPAVNCQPARARGARSSGVCRDAARARAGPRAISRSVVPGSFEKADRAGRPRPAAGAPGQPAAGPVALGIPSLSARQEASEV